MTQLVPVEARSKNGQLPRRCPECGIPQPSAKHLTAEIAQLQARATELTSKLAEAQFELHGSVYSVPPPWVAAVSGAVYEPAPPEYGPSMDSSPDFLEQRRTAES